MKWRYLKIGVGTIWGTNELTKDDLVRRKDGYYDHIIDLERMVEFDPEENSWVDLKGEE